MRMLTSLYMINSRDLSRFIPSKKLNCVIDRVNGLSFDGCD
jgi:hypothetical protein